MANKKQMVKAKAAQIVIPDNPLSLIEKGIVSNDMAMVAKGYAALTGKVIDVNTSLKVHEEAVPAVCEPKAKRGRPKKKELVPSEIVVPLDPEKPEPAVALINQSVQANGSAVRASGVNLFHDDGNGNVYIGNEKVGNCADDQKIDTLIRRTKGDRRAPARMVEMVCVRCKRTVKVHLGQAALYANPENQEDQRPAFSCGCG